MVDLSHFISHDAARDVLLAAVALFLRTVVKLLKKIHAVFDVLDENLKKIDEKLKESIKQNDIIIVQNKRFTDKIISIEERQRAIFYNMSDKQYTKKDWMFS